MPTVRLTQLGIDKLAPPASGRVVYWDRHLPGFGLRVTETGSRSWVAKYRVAGRAVMETLGQVAKIPKVDDARKAARESMAKAATGEHPVVERKARERRGAVSTFKAVADRYVERYAKKQTRPATWRELERLLARDLLPRWGDRPIVSIKRQDVVDLIDAIESRGSPIQANRTLAYIKTMFGWALREELIESNPTECVLKPAKERTRDRVLNDDEITRFWSACEAQGWPFGSMGKLLLLTAQRLDEVAGMRWPELGPDNRSWVIPRERAKNDRAHEVHISELAAEVIAGLPHIDDSEFVFTTTGTTAVSGFSKAKAAIDRRMGGSMARWTFHDLRRTAATGMARLNIPPHVVDRLLNHVAGEIRGVAAIYNRHAYLEERAAALEAWGHHIEQLLGREPQNVVAMRRPAGV